MSRGRQDNSGEAGFLARWSRRKQQSRNGRGEIEEPPLDTAPPVPAVADAAVTEEADESALSDADLLAKYDLPDPETLTASDDVAVFMRKSVPTRLRNLALRRIWRLDPVLANLDGLNDYDDDYTDAAMMAGVVKTAYQVGRGGAAHLQDAADKLAADKLAAGGVPEPDQEPVPEQGDDTQHEENRVAEAGDRGVSVLRDGEAHQDVMSVPEVGTEGGMDRNLPEPVTVTRPAPAELPRRRRMVFATADGDGLHTGSQNSNK